MNDFLTEPNNPEHYKLESPIKPLFTPFYDPEKADSEFKAAGTPFLTEEALRKATEGAFKYKYGPKTYLHPDDYNLIAENLESKVKAAGTLSTAQFLNRGRLAQYLTINAANPQSDVLFVPFLAKPISGNLIPAVEDSKIAVKLLTIPVESFTERAADEAIFTMLKRCEDYEPHVMSPETTVVEKLSEAINLTKLKGLWHEKTAILTDYSTYDKFILEADISNPNPNTFMGVPIVVDARLGNGDIYIINPKTAFVYAADEVVGPKSIKAGAGLFPDSVVVTSDPTAHVVSKHFDNETNDWCIDCWTCGYSSWAATEEEASERLINHSDKDTKLYYRK